MQSQIIQRLNTLYHDVDKQTARLSAVHSKRLQCKSGCAECCVDEITVFEVEAEYIRHHCGELLQHADPHQPGACAFLDRAGNCRIYAHRPYVCRTQGLPLHWIEEADDGSVVAFRDICPKNDRGVPVEQLTEDACWVIGPVEERLARMQHGYGRGEMRRVGLRELFEEKYDRDC